jgi:hypothetical protein
MNPTTIRLNNMTVAELRVVARQMELRGFGSISKMRKADLIILMAAQIDIEHSNAFIADGMYASTRKMVASLDKLIAPKVSLMDYPVPYGRPVTEAHVKICQTRGHVSYVKDGMDTGICPRCGEVTTSEEQVEIDPMNRIREVMTNGTAFQPAWMSNDSEKKENAANNAVIEIAHAGINALTPVLATAKATFENVRDHGTDADIEIAYQIYCDVTRAMEEFTRTVAYAENP